MAVLAGCASDAAPSTRPRATDGLARRTYAAAAECGLREKDIGITDAAGERSFIIQPSAMRRPGSAFNCFLNWARKNDVSVGFVSEPPPETS
jgi:hypothetical protein